jgi:NTE family protein
VFALLLFAQLLFGTAAGRRLAEAPAACDSFTVTTAFVLAGGGSLGAVQVGMLSALLRAGIRPHRVYGSSTGAINAAAFAAMPSLAGIDRLVSGWQDLSHHEVYPADRGQAFRALLRSAPLLPLGLIRAAGLNNDVYPFRPLAALAGVAGLADSLVPRRARARMIKRLVPLAQLDLAAVPLELEAAEITSGRLVPLSVGDALSALLACTALPGLCSPECVGPSMLMDASLAETTAVDRAVDGGADEVYVLPSGFACDLDDPPPTAYGVAVHASTVLIEQRLMASIARADPRVAVYAVPPLCPLPVVPVDFGHSVELMLRAEEATRRWLRSGHRPVPGLSRSLGAHGASGVLDLTAAGLGVQPG